MGYIRISVDTDDRRLAFDLFGNPKQIGAGSKTSVPGNAELVMKSMLMRKAFGLSETLELVLSFSSGVASSLVASWLYEKLRNRPNTTLRIEEQQIELEEGQIRRVFTRFIERKDG